MRGAALPAALLCAAFGLMLAFAPRRAMFPALAILCFAALLAVALPVHGEGIEIAFVGCWISVIILSAMIHLPRGVPPWLAWSGALAAGCFAGAVIAGQGERWDLARALPAALIALPASWFVGKGWQIAVKVVSSWLIAVALLAALLPTSVTPGYVPDHMD